MQPTLMHEAHFAARRSERPGAARPTVRQLLPLGRPSGSRRSR
ncbi:MAG TPA: hypothetical protein VGP78_12380 [Solirubrobacteraceae bacterium]|nr:hypothetical protein [Solirubrobacteraceae bacterium]